MTSSIKFSNLTKHAALERQSFKCASCGEEILALGESGQTNHRFGERADAHHMKHKKFGGTGEIDNCVVLCWSCHYSAHEGGNYKKGKVIGTDRDFPYFYKQT